MLPTGIVFAKMLVVKNLEALDLNLAQALVLRTLDVRSRFSLGVECPVLLSGDRTRKLKLLDLARMDPKGSRSRPRFRARPMLVLTMGLATLDDLDT